MRLYQQIEFRSLLSTLSSVQNGTAAVFLKDIVEPAYKRARKSAMPVKLELGLAKGFCECNPIKPNESTLKLKIKSISQTFRKLQLPGIVSFTILL